MKKLALQHLTTHDREAVEGFQQFLHWAGPVDRKQNPLRHLASAYCNGLMTIEEGKRIEAGRQVWQEVLEGPVLPDFTQGGNTL